MRSSKRVRALLTALVATLATMVATPSQANHDTRTLDVTPETATGQGGIAVVFTATLSSAAAGNTEVDFEIEGGPNDVSGASNPAGSSPSQPDFSCTVLSGDTACTGSYTPVANNLDQIRAWIDHDKNNATTEADSAEQANEITGAGEVGEPDVTDVVQGLIVGTVASNVLDCDDESPGTNADDDTTTNPTTGSQDQTNETFTCKVTFNGNPIINAAVDAEIISGPNDPDAGKTGTPDFTCTTVATGECTIIVPNTAGTLNPGVTIVCFWNDAGNDDLVDNTTATNGGDCAEAHDETENNDVTDTAKITWVARAAVRVDIVNEDDSRVLPVQNSHTVNVRALDQFGVGFGGVNIDFSIIGGPNRDTISTARDCTTVADGTCSITYNSGGFNGIDEFCAWRDTETEDLYNAAGPEGDGGGCATEPQAPGDENDGPPAFTDRGRATWSGGNSIATQLEVTPEVAPGGSVVEGTNYSLTVSVKDENGNAMASQTVNFEILGAGDPDGTDGGTPDITCTTAANGSCVVEFTSNVQGLSKVRAWVNGQQADLTEGPDAGASPDEPSTSPDQPGSTIEPDTTDMVAVQWGRLATGFNPFTRSHSVGTYGLDPIISGRLIKTQDGSPVDGVQVLIKHRYTSQSTFSLIATRTTNGDGRFSFQHFNPSANSLYQVLYGGSGTLNEATSPTLRIDIRPGVIFNVSTATPQRNRPVTISGAVIPGHAGKNVSLQYLDGRAGVWRHVKSVTLDRNSRFSFSYTRNGPGFLLFRLLYATQDIDHTWNVSRNIKVTWQ